MSDEPVFRAESAGKKLARNSLWINICRELRAGVVLPLDDVRFMRTAVLAGPDGGDIGYLRTVCQTQPSEILAIDSDPVAARECETKHPGFRVVVGDCFETIKKQPRASFDVIAMDFCSTFSESLVTKVASLTPWIRSGGILAVGHMYGRDAPPRRKYGLRIQHKPVPGIKRRHAGATERMVYMWSGILDRAPCSDGVVPLFGLSYHSRTDARGTGSPMAWTVMRVMRLSKKILMGKARHGWADFGHYEILSGREAEQNLRELVSDEPWSRDSADFLAAAFSVPKGKIGAWRAVNTRTRRRPPAEAAK